MRLLEQAGIAFRTREYAWDEDDLSGVHAAEALGLPAEQVFKTLVTRAASGGIYVFCIPVAEELELKKAARAVREKSLTMVHVKELLPLTGYIRGGCSPVGMKKKYPTVLDETAILFDEIAVSAGRRGAQLLLSPAALAEYVGAELADVTV